MKQRARKPGSSIAGPPDPSAAGAYRLEEQVGFRVRKVHQRATEIFNAVMADFDITPMQFAALAKVHDLGSVSQNQLGRLVAMDPATIFGVVGRLMKRGLVAQHLDPQDARLALIALTPQGRDLVIAMKALGSEVSIRTLAPLSETEGRQLLALLARLE